MIPVPAPRTPRTPRRTCARVLLVCVAGGIAFACRSASATRHDDATAAGAVSEPAGAAASAAKTATPPASTVGSQSAAPGNSDAAVERGRVLVPGGRAFDVEVVQDPGSRERGLQNRSRLGPNEGMLFIFPAAGRLRFWMYECLIPLDILWIDAGRTVIHVEESLPICSKEPCPDYGPDGDALYVLELGAGVARQAGIRSGTHLTLLFDHPPNPR